MTLAVTFQWFTSLLNDHFCVEKKCISHADHPTPVGKHRYVTFNSDKIK